MKPDYGHINQRPMPQAPDLEQSVLGACMLETTAIQTVIDILRPESFYRNENAQIFEAILELWNLNIPVDILTVTHRLRFNGNLDSVGGPLYISQLTNRVASTANIETHARIICQKLISREIIRLAHETIDLAYEDTTDVFDLLDLHNSTINKILHENATADALSVKQVMEETTKEVSERAVNKDFVVGVFTYLKSVDDLMMGYQNTDLIYVAGRPSMGKTAYILSNILQQGLKGIPVAVFSLEMSNKQLVYRLASQITGIEVQTLMKWGLPQDKLREYFKAVDIISPLPIHIDHTPALNVFSFRAKVTRMVQKHGIKAVYVDYLQLMTAGSAKKGGYNNREQEIALISRTLKQTAKENNVPVIALSQLSRQSEGRINHAPLLSDLRESGAIEQDADVVIFPYRPEYYNATDKDGNSTAGLAEIIVAKNRNGKLGTAKAKFIDYMAKFTDLDAMGWTPKPDNRIESGTADLF